MFIWKGHMKKSLYAALMVSAALTCSAEAAQNAGSTNARIAKLEQAIAELKAQAEQDRVQQQKDGNAFRIPGTSQTVQLVLNPMVNVIGDLGQRGDDMFWVGDIPLERVDGQHRGKGGFSMTPAGTQIGFKTNHDTEKGPIKSHVEMDFFGRTNRLQPRLRHAYVTHRGFLIGHTNTLFHDLDAIGDTCEQNGAMGAPLRQAQLRLGWKCEKGLEVAVSAERPFTDTVRQDDTNAAYEFASTKEGTTTRGTYSQPAAPDGVVALKYATPMGHIGLQGVIRDMRVKHLNDSAGNGENRDYKVRRTALGFGVTTNINFSDKFRAFGQYQSGRGVARYLPDAEGYSAYLDETNKKFELLRANHYLVGTEFKWTPEVRSNVMYNHAHITPNRNMSSEVKRYNKNLKQLFVNTFVTPLPKTDVGLEYMYGERETQTGNKGKAHRVQMLFIYKF